MRKKIEFTQKNREDLREFILNDKRDKVIFNFLNLYSVYLYRTDKDVAESIDNMQKSSINSADGFPISLFLRLKRNRGTDFTLFVLNDKELSEKRKHLFIGVDSEDKESINKIINKFNYLNEKNVLCYNPPYIKKSRFSKEEVEKITKIINSEKVDFIWVGVGNPKQEILSGDLYDNLEKGYLFNVGAALDFINEKKKESPKFLQNIGLEWSYRFFTDFKHSGKKILKSLIGIVYMPITIKKKSI